MNVLIMYEIILYRILKNYERINLIIITVKFDIVVPKYIFYSFAMFDVCRIWHDHTFQIGHRF